MWGKCGERFLSFYICRNDKKRRYMTVKFLIRKEGRRTVEEARQESMSASKMGEGLM